MAPRFPVASAILGFALLLGASTEARAGPVTFTWDPSGATPALTSGPSAFSADSMSLTNYIRATATNNLTTLKQTAVADQIQTIDDFTLGGASVTAPGLNSTYGLYFRLATITLFPINGGGTMVGPGVYTLLDVQLVGDGGHDDGSVVNNAAGIGFSDAAGVSNDVVLATGSLLSASLSINANGSRNAHYSTTFQPVAAETGFFPGTSSGLNLEIFLNTAASSFQVVPVDSLTVLNVVGADGNSRGTAQLVAEPASLGVLCTALAGLIRLRKRHR